LKEYWRPFRGVHVDVLVSFNEELKVWKGWIYVVKKNMSVSFNEELKVAVDQHGIRPVVGIL